MEKTDLDLPEDCILLFSFNQSCKIEPAMFYMWVEILLAVPGTYLWLYPRNKIAENNLK
jgi:predicted O-linked N-acetylglucosamine transferase (SPINDLY family)